VGGLESFRGEMLQASSSSKSGNSLGIIVAFKYLPVSVQRFQIDTQLLPISWARVCAVFGLIAEYLEGEEV